MNGEIKMNVKHPIIIKGNANKEPHLKGTYNFKGEDKEMDKLYAICSKCKHFDQESDFPNAWCDHHKHDVSPCMIDYWWCDSRCPLGKWKIVDPKEDK